MTVDALPGGSRILDCLHSRGEALDLTAAQPVKAVYADYRDSEYIFDIESFAVITPLVKSAPLSARSCDDHRADHPCLC